MRNTFAALFFLVAVAACSKGSSTISASPSPANATKALGCDFTIPNRNGELTQQWINEAVASVPAAIRTDMRAVYEASMKYTADTKAAQAAPQAQRPDLYKKATADLNNASYRGAAQRLRVYLTEHCTGLRRRATPSP